MAWINLLCMEQIALQIKSHLKVEKNRLAID